MFSVETTYYCTSCGTVQVKDWQFNEGIDALAMYDYLIDKYYDNEDILTSFIELRWKKDDDTSPYQKSATMYYYHKSIDTSVSGVDSIVIVDDGVRKIFDDMHNISNKEAA